MIFTKEYIDFLNTRLDYKLIVDNYNDQTVIRFKNPKDAYQVLSYILYAFQGKPIEIKLQVRETECCIIEYLDE